MLHYILQITAFQVFFLLVYDLFLKRETFFNWNRFYLLGTAILSFVLPFIKLDTIKAMAPEDFVINLPEVILGTVAPTVYETHVALQAGIVLEQPKMPLWETILWIGISIAALIFAFKIAKIYLLRYKNPTRWKGNVLIIKLLNSKVAFSFFNNIFLGEKIGEEEERLVLKHELVHVKEKHSIDLLFFEILRILMWFNPLVYMYQNRIKALHEYIADAIAVKEDNRVGYYQSLLNQVFETNNLSFTNSFFKQSLIKKRIVMLQKSKSKRASLIKYALLLPLIFGMLIYTSAEVRAQEKETEVITETIQISDLKQSEKELIDKYYKEFKALFEAGNISEMMKQISRDKSRFKMSLDEYARSRALTRIIHDDRIKEKIKAGTAKDSEIERLKRFESQNQTYADYIESTKTEKYIKDWESKTEDGTLRLFVKDLTNRTPKEQKRYDEIIALIDKDEYWHALLMTNGKESTALLEFDTNKPISVTEEVVVEQIKESIEVPFSVIENAPTTKECEDLPTNEERKKCSSKTISKFVNKNFNTSLGKTLGLEGRQRISVFFKIDENGNVTSVGARAPHPKLAEEAKRVVNMLPQFIPGKQRGKTVTVPYSLPIIFQVHGDETNKKAIPETREVVIEQIKESIEVPFSVIENAPTTKECEDLPTNDERKKCSSKMISKFVNKNFNTDLATTHGLEGRQRISVFFKIDKSGYVTSVGARAPHPKLEDEAKRVINMLPQFIPGKQRGKTVTVPYSLPIIFQVQSVDTTNEKTKN